MGIYYMAVSHKDWELPNSQILLAVIDIKMFMAPKAGLWPERNYG